MSPNGTIGIAVQGAGNVSTGHLTAYLNNPACRVVAIGSRTTESAARKAAEVGLDPAQIGLYASVEELLAHPGVDAVSICTPHSRHAEDAIAAADAGKHCLIEKPVAMDAEQLRAMDVAVARAGVRTVCGFVLRWNPSVLASKAIIERGMLGRLRYVQTDYWHNPAQSGYPGAEHHLQHMDASAMMLGGCHAVDLARYLMGSDIVEVSAQQAEGAPAHPFPTMQTAVVKFANGAIGKVSACVEQWMPYQFNVDVLGTDGGLRDDRFYSRTLPGVTDWVTFPTILPTSGAVSHHPFQGEIDHFLDCVRDDVESHASLRDAVNTHHVCFAVDASAAAGGTPIRISSADAAPSSDPPKP